MYTLNGEAKSKYDLIIYLFRSIHGNRQLSIKRLTAKSADVYLNTAASLEETAELQTFRQSSSFPDDSL